MTRWRVHVLVLALGAACSDRAPDLDTRGAVGASGRYHFVGARGARAFATAGAAARVLEGSDALAPGFGLLIVEERVVAGVRVGRSAAGRWMALDALEPARPSPFAGVRLGAGPPEAIAWAVAPAPIFAAPAPQARKLGVHPRLGRVHITGACRDGFCPTAGGWVPEAALRRPRGAPRPAQVQPTERWIDVDRETQTLVAYEGDQARFATLVSTGIGRAGSPLATPVGVFRIHTKRRRSRMDNLEHDGLVPYAYEDVPHVQTFTGRVSLHAALWHDRFGAVASHGCINAAPADAAWLFAFTAPAVLESAGAAHASVAKPGTVLRVR